MGGEVRQTHLMSDYQTITVLSKTKNTLRILVEEVHPDCPELAPIVSGGASVSGQPLPTLDHPDVIKFAAMLIFDEKGRSGDVAPLEDFEAQSYVRSLHFESSEAIGRSSHEGFSLMKAILVIELVSSSHLEQFKEGEILCAAASVDGDFDECFG